MSTIADLEAAARKLSPKDQLIAASLYEQMKSKGNLTAKQWAFVDVLVERATKPTPEAAALISGLAAAVAGVSKPGAKKTRVFLPCIDAAEEPITLLAEPAGQHSVNKGAVYLYVAPGSAAKKGAYAGKVMPSGEFFPAASGLDVDAIRVALLGFIDRPVATMQAAGQALGCCCNCGRDLTHPASVALGVGSTCVKYLGLAAEWSALAKQLKGKGN